MLKSPKQTVTGLGGPKRRNPVYSSREISSQGIPQRQLNARNNVDVVKVRQMHELISDQNWIPRMKGIVRQGDENTRTQ